VPPSPRRGIAAELYSGLGCPFSIDGCVISGLVAAGADTLIDELDNHEDALTAYTY
jgi:hypothetical protein